MVCGSGAGGSSSLLAFSEALRSVDVDLATSAACWEALRTILACFLDSRRACDALLDALIATFSATEWPSNSLTSFSVALTRRTNEPSVAGRLERSLDESSFTFVATCVPGVTALIAMPTFARLFFRTRQTAVRTTPKATRVPATTPTMMTVFADSSLSEVVGCEGGVDCTAAAAVGAAGVCCNIFGTETVIDDVPIDIDRPVLVLSAEKTNVVDEVNSECCMLDASVVAAASGTSTTSKSILTDPGRIEVMTMLLIGKFKAALSPCLASALKLSTSPTSSNGMSTEMVDDTLNCAVGFAEVADGVLVVVIVVALPPVFEQNTHGGGVVVVASCSISHDDQEKLLPVTGGLVVAVSGAAATGARRGSKLTTA